MTRQRPHRPTTHLDVISKEWLSPDMLRLVVGGPNFGAFADAGVADAYIKLVFDPEGKPYPQPVDVSQMRAELPGEQWPKIRTYTVRSVDHEAQTLAIDFVIHGDEGIAAPWAGSAEPGDLVQFMGPGGKWLPSEDAGFHLFVGDESAVPAIAAGLERLPEDAIGAVVLEASEHAIELDKPEGVSVQWSVRGDAEYDPEALSRRVRGLDLASRSEELSVFAHGEREAMKQLRRVFSELEVPRERLSISGYWAYGRAEDVFQEEKRTDVGKV